MRAHGIRGQIHRASEHLAKLEQAFGVSDLGWDSFWQSKRQSLVSSFTDSPLDYWLYVYWGVLCIINLVIPLALKLVQ